MSDFLVDPAPAKHAQGPVTTHCANTHSNARAYTLTHTYTHIHTQTHIHIHTHTLTHPKPGVLEDPTCQYTYHQKLRLLRAQETPETGFRISGSLPVGSSLRFYCLWCFLVSLAFIPSLPIWETEQKSHCPSFCSQK